MNSATWKTDYVIERHVVRMALFCTAEKCVAVIWDNARRGGSDTRKMLNCIIVLLLLSRIHRKTKCKLANCNSSLFCLSRSRAGSLQIALFNSTFRVQNTAHKRGRGKHLAVTLSPQECKVAINHTQLLRDRHGRARRFTKRRDTVDKDITGNFFSEMSNFYRNPKHEGHT